FSTRLRNQCTVAVAITQSKPIKWDWRILFTFDNPIHKLGEIYCHSPNMDIVIPIILILSILTWRLFRTDIKGAIGEKTTSSILYFLDKSKYKVINNIVLKSGEKTTQIDHLVI